MNVIDKVVSIFSPQTAFKREVARKGLKFINAGYSESGASTRKNSMKGWNPISRSPQEDIDPNLQTLRQRSRDLFMSGPIGRGAIITNRTNIVGAGLRPKPTIDYKYLRLTPEQADAWEENTFREFNVWAKSVHCDILRLCNFYEMQGLALMSWLLNGEGFAAIKFRDRTQYMPYQLRLHLFEADRVSTPQLTQGIVTWGKETVKLSNGNRIYSGIEVDSDGAVVAYYVCNRYPGDKTNSQPAEWVRVEAFGQRTGMPNIIHIIEPERCEQYHGVPYLAPVMEAMKQTTRYTEAELMAAIVQAFFTAFIKQEKQSSGVFPLGDSIAPGEQLQDEAKNANDYELGAGSINVLDPGEDVVFADPKRPSSGFEAFTTAMLSQIGMALELPYELLVKKFNSSYSAARAALLEAWKAFRMRRTWFANRFCQPVYELWLAEAVATGRIIAPGFFTDPRIRAAWCGVEWVGPAPGQVDPVKEVQAAELRIKNFLSTHDREATEINGSEFDRNAEEIRRENILISQAQAELSTSRQERTNMDDQGGDLDNG